MCRPITYCWNIIPTTTRTHVNTVEPVTRRCPSNGLHITNVVLPRPPIFTILPRHHNFKAEPPTSACSVVEDDSSQGVISWFIYLRSTDTHAFQASVDFATSHLRSQYPLFPQSYHPFQMQTRRRLKSTDMI